MICDWGDVAIVPFPFVEREVAKRRPALVLSRRSFNEDNAHTLFAMITTGARSSWASDLVLADWNAAGLSHRSLIRWKVFTLPNALVLRVAGALSETDRTAAAAALRSVLPQ